MACLGNDAGETSWRSSRLHRICRCAPLTQSCAPVALAALQPPIVAGGARAAGVFWTRTGACKARCAPVALAPLQAGVVAGGGQAQVVETLGQQRPGAQAEQYRHDRDVGDVIWGVRVAKLDDGLRNGSETVSVSAERKLNMLQCTMCICPAEVGMNCRRKNAAEPGWPNLVPADVKPSRQC